LSRALQLEIGECSWLPKGCITSASPRLGKETFCLAQRRAVLPISTRRHERRSLPATCSPQSPRSAHQARARRAPRSSSTPCTLRARTRGLSERRCHRETLDTVIDWGRFAEIFAYDDQAEMFSLEDPKGCPFRCEAVSVFYKGGASSETVSVASSSSNVGAGCRRPPGTQGWTEREEERD
jgi:hypothetical protein